MRDYIMRLCGWRRLSGALTAAAIGTAALSAVSCRSQRCVEQRTELRSDSTWAVSTESVTAETLREAVPGDSVRVTVTMKVMENLPDGAVFSRKSGRTRVSLRREGDAIVAEAETDSVEREVRRYERRARDSLRCGERLEYSGKVEERNRHRDDSRCTGAFWLVLGALGIFIVIRRFIK